MADNPQLNDALQGYLGAFGNPGGKVESFLGQLLLPGGFGNYNFGYNVFPEDLSSSYYGHWMTITALTQTPGNYISTPGSATHPSYTVGLFIPSDIGGGGGVQFRDKHEYSDIRITNLMGSAIGAIGGALGGGVSGAVTGITDKLPSYLGHPINPGVEVLYKSTELRNHQFSFLLAPSSENESKALKDIVYNIRRFAAPKLNDNNSWYLDTPAEFIIKFYYNGKENTNIPKIKRSVITDIDVNYTPQGEWSTFSNGHPVSCLLSISFSEMELIFRQSVEEGY